MAKDKVELDALSAMGFSVGCQVIAMREAITSQLGLSTEQLEAFNASYDKTYLSEMEMLIEELEDDGPEVAGLLREMVAQKGGEPEQPELPEQSDQPELPSPGTESSLLEKIEAACAKVAAEKPSLLSRKLDERTIAGRIAYHLQPLVPGYFVDCAYNKAADSIGADALKKLSEHDAGAAIPDIIIHDRKRGTGGNLAVIEAKWSSDDAALEQATTKIGLYLDEPKLAYKSGFLLLLKKDSIHVEPIGERSDDAGVS